MNPALLSVQTPIAVLAEEAESKTGAIGPGLTAFLIVAALGVATFLLVRSMLNQIKKVPPTFDPPPEEGNESADDHADR